MEHAVNFVLLIVSIFWFFCEFFEKSKTIDKTVWCKNWVTYPFFRLTHIWKFKAKFLKWVTPTVRQNGEMRYSSNFVNYITYITIYRHMPIIKMENLRKRLIWSRILRFFFKLLILFVYLKVPQALSL